ncbi:glycerate kinase [Photobacterium sp. ZSDE20]|uniref:Glycerate kinase n=1 Tax=Photobacterium pectinilyticum TaxID=2906793 RepID=A0ABT1NBN9_9GAMM|nr:glycerate kinase [Photobacterium sp. ZSDE20]MCQ1060744.1 glycerate kinase [Photobacterium sp. ZSDE20]MDD1828314.1 glycerate kinase [Photobacterium sp. ZSDE20]
MKIVIAPDSFKESLSAAEVCRAIKKGITQRLPSSEVVCVPMADGGEGTLDALVDATNGHRHTVKVMGPLPDMQVEAQFGMLGDGETAVIEMARASGIELLTSDQRDPRLTTSYGTGQLISAALDVGAKRLIVAIGGSATNDGGAGMMQALGVRFLDKYRYPIGHGGAQLSRIADIDMEGLDPRLAGVEVIAACDVDNPLIGVRGASAIFGPQKGATPDVVEQLDLALARYAGCIDEKLGCQVVNVPGAGAAGGMGAGLLAFMQAELKPGITIVSDTVSLAEKLRGADWVITGEGRVDGQTLGGKTPAGVAKLAQSMGIPTIALAGSLGDGCDALRQVGIVACFSILSKPCTLSQALAGGTENLTLTAFQVAGMMENQTH